MQFIKDHPLFIYLLVCYITTPLIVWISIVNLKKRPALAIGFIMVRNLWAQFLRKKKSEIFLYLLASFVITVALLPFLWPILVSGLPASIILLYKKPAPINEVIIPSEADNLEFDQDSL